MSTDPEETYDPGRCSPCRGTGRVLSNKGGTPAEVECPWCEGRGRFLAEHDAQAARRQQAEA